MGVWDARSLLEGVETWKTYSSLSLEKKTTRSGATYSSPCKGGIYNNTWRMAGLSRRFTSARLHLFHCQSQRVMSMPKPVHTESSLGKGVETQKSYW